MLQYIRDQILELAKESLLVVAISGRKLKLIYPINNYEF